VEVQIARVDKQARQIDFLLVSGGNGRHGRGQAGAATRASALEQVAAPTGAAHGRPSAVRATPASGRSRGREEGRGRRAGGSAQRAGARGGPRRTGRASSRSAGQSEDRTRRPPGRGGGRDGGRGKGRGGGRNRGPGP
jgi:hypothetical protein